MYSAVILIVVLVLIFYYEPRYGKTHLIVYVGICSLMGSLTVCSFFSLSLLSIFPQALSLVLLGYECESCCHRHKADVFRDESVQILPNLDFYYSSHGLLHFANQLLEQGKQKAF